MSVTAVTRYHLVLRTLHWTIAVCAILELVGA